MSSAQDKLTIVKKALAGGETVSSIASDFGVSRKTIYQWMREYQFRINSVQESAIFESKRAKGVLHPRAVYPKVEGSIKKLALENPLLTTRDIAQRTQVSKSTVWNILNNNNISHIDQRLAYAQVSPIPTITSTGVSSLSSLVEVFRVAKYFLTSMIITLVAIYSYFWWVSLVAGLSNGAEFVGIVFASTALLAGMLFFLYSIKYYITLAVVLSFSQSSVNSDQSAVNGRKKGLLSWILGNLRPESKAKSFAAGLTPDLSHITLEKYPFISVHIPFYNEKKVVERSIQAAVNFDYKGDYEVILCDDSTDETTQIIANYLKSQAPNIKSQTGDDWKLTQGEVRPGVVVKHIHRSSRAGFKGGALELARKLTDPRAEFVSVFDADFVPYPDTLTLFLKYFLASSGTLDFKKVTGGNKNTNHQSLITNHNPIAAVQGYQWHVLNKSENWITRGVRSEYSGSYVIERSGTELYGGLKQISGSVYMIRKDILDSIGWGTSITEDFELTLKLYEKGYKVVYTPYIQAPSECVSTIKRLVRQRMRWAEGHSYNIRRMFPKLITNPNLTTSEKLEFLYLSPYYLQAFFFLIGTISWLISETIFPARLPFWTALWGWSLVLTNMISLPLMNAVGMFLEESEHKDYQGILSFVILSYLVVPFQAYAAVKGFLEQSEGPWFRTPKTGRITDIFRRASFFRWIGGILPGRSQVVPALSQMTNYQFARPAGGLPITNLKH